MRRNNFSIPPWQIWSYSKFRSLNECPLKFFFDHILRIRKPQAPILVVGSALHYMAFRFFRVMYRTADSFCGAWKHFWFSVCDGVHGPSGFRDQPVEINWKWPKEKFHWLHQGAEIMTKFFDRHRDHRGTGMAAMAERRFRLANWRNVFTLTGVIDIVDGGVEIVDYKMGLYPAYMLNVRGSYQPTFYQIAYEEQLARHLDDRPLVSVRIENLFTGGSQAFDIRAAAEMDELYYGLVEGSTYVQSFLEHRRLPEILHQPIRRFPITADGQYVLWPRLPREAGHCNTCPYIEECQRWEAEHRHENALPDAVRVWQAYHLARRRQRMPTQTELRIFEE